MSTNDKTTEALIPRLQAAIEGECNGLALDEKTARSVLEHLFSEAQGATPEPAIWYMRDNHSCRRLPLDVDAAVAILREEFDAGQPGGMLTGGDDLRHLGVVHAPGSKADWPAFEVEARQWLAKVIAAADAVRAPAEPSPDTDGWLLSGTLIYRLTDGWQPQNRDEVRVQRADESLHDESKLRALAARVHRLLSDAEPQPAPASDALPEPRLICDRLVYLAEDMRAWGEKCAAQAVAVEREACALVAESGRFLHDDAPTARLGRECAAAIRRRSEAAQAVVVAHQTAIGETQPALSSASETQPAQAGPSDEEIEELWCEHVRVSRSVQGSSPLYAFARALLARYGSQPGALPDEREALTAVREAITDYHLALDKHNHGGVAAHHAISAIEEALAMPWIPGETLASDAQPSEGAAP